MLLYWQNLETEVNKIKMMAVFNRHFFGDTSDSLIARSIWGVGGFLGPIRR